MQSIYKSKNNKKAFTLIELLIVIAIIGILFIVLVSRVDFATDKAKATGVQTDFRAFQMAFEQVSKENAGFATFGWDTGDKSKDSLWNGQTTPDGQAYSYANKDKDAGDRIKNSYDLGDANLNGIQETGETWVGRKIYTEEWSGVWTLMHPTNPNDYSAIVALESAINANLDPKLHITINNDYTINMANGAVDAWGTQYHGYYLSNAAVDKLDRGAIVLYSNGANKTFGLTQMIANGCVKISIPGNNIYGQDDYSLVSCYSLEKGYGETVLSTTGFASNHKFLSDNKQELPITQMMALNGTKWQFNNEVSYDSTVFGQFNYEEQTGWDEFSSDSYITNGSITYHCWGFTMIEEFGCQFFCDVSSTAEEYAFLYIPENPLGLPTGWCVIDNAYGVDILEGRITDLDEALEHIYPTIAPTIVFSDTTSEILQDTTFIQWLQMNATQK